MKSLTRLIPACVLGIPALFSRLVSLAAVLTLSFVVSVETWVVYYAVGAFGKYCDGWMDGWIWIWMITFLQSITDL